MAPPNDKIEPLYDARVIAARIAELAVEITERLGRDIMVVSVLKGSFVFAADLLRAMHHQGAHPQVDFHTLNHNHAHFKQGRQHRDGYGL